MVLPHLHEFHVRDLAVTLCICAAERMSDLVSDALVRLSQIEDIELICRRIGDAPLLTCATVGYLAWRGVSETPADLTGHLLVNETLHMPARHAPGRKAPPQPRPR